MAARDERAPVVGIAMGSDSDRKYLIPAAHIFERFGVPYETRVKSAHRTHKEMIEWGESAVSRGLKAILAAAGGSAHLPGMLASTTRLPVIGLPVGSTERTIAAAEGSMYDMPPGVPLATTGVVEKGAKNAALYIVRILALSDPGLAEACEQFSEEMRLENVAKDARMLDMGILDYTPLPTA
jgi:phosphoribosylaminoimidazole carboxylase PurE protein